MSDNEHRDSSDPVKDAGKTEAKKKNRKEKKSGQSWSVHLLSWFRALNSAARTAVIAVAVIAALAILIPAVTATTKFFSYQEATVTTEVETALKRIEESSQLATMEYIYNGVAKGLEKPADPDSRVLYYVSYQGTVRAGIDFQEIEVKPDPEDETKIQIFLPDIKIHDTDVVPGSLDYIFLDPAAETETVNATAFTLCEDQLRSAAAEDQSLLSMARDNAEETLKALMDPLIAQLDPEMQIEFVQDSETEQEEAQ